MKMRLFLLALVSCMASSLEFGWGWLVVPAHADFRGARVIYFPIDASGDEAEWRESSVREALKWGGPENTLAWTNWGGTGAWYCEDGLVGGMTVDWGATVYLPFPENLSVEKIPAWNSYFNWLADHEALHVQVLFDHLIDFQGINGTPCDEAIWRFERLSGYISKLEHAIDGEAI